jgi:glycosyltransferase involved in cell wall biosynthesis
MTVTKDTVTMMTHNAENCLPYVMGSILGRTFEDFELLVVDDGSFDKSADIMRSYDDPRIRVLGNQRIQAPLSAERRRWNKLMESTLQFWTQMISRSKRDCRCRSTFWIGTKTSS